MPTFKFSQWVLICMTARTKVNDGKVARLQVHQDVLVLDVPDGQHEKGKVNQDVCEYGDGDEDGDENGDEEGDENRYEETRS